MRVMFGVALFLSIVLVGYAADPLPHPGMPTSPVTQLPHVKTPALPEKPDLFVNVSAAGLGGLSDLYPDRPGMGPSSFRVGGQVLNRGRVAVRGCAVFLFLSQDKKVSPDDRILDRITLTETIPPFDGFRFGSAVMPWKEYGIAGIPAGTYFVCAKVDPLNAIAETDENNNESCSVEPIRIHPAGTK
jgi:hypothetical protein